MKALARYSRSLDEILYGIGLLSPGERRMAQALALVIPVVEFMQLVGMLLVVPVVGVLIDEALFTTSPHIKQLASLLGNPSFEQFVPMLTGLALLLVIVANAGTFALHVVIERFTARAQSRLVSDVLTACIQAPYPWFFDRNPAALTRLFHQDFPIWGREFIGSVLLFLSNLLTVLAGSVLIIAFAPGRGLVALTALGIVSWLTLVVVRRNLTFWTRIKRAAAERGVVIANEILSGIKDVKVSGAEQHYVMICAQKFREMSLAACRAVNFGAVPAALLMILAQAGLLLILLMLWYAGHRGASLAAQMTLVMLVVSRVIPALSRLAGVATRLFNAIPWIAGIRELRTSLAQAERESVPTGRLAVPPDWSRLKFEHVVFAYRGRERPVLDDLSLELDDRNCYGLIGTSGTGKTTLVDLILGLLTPTQGQILVDSTPLADIDTAQWRRNIGYVSQSPFFVDGPLRDNVIFGGPVDEDRLLESIEMAGLKEFVASLPKGANTRLGDRALSISGGQRQRIAIARALYRKPQVLVMDEATASLDAESEKVIIETLATLKSRIMILIVSHRPSTLSICDRVFSLAEGRVELVDASDRRSRRRPDQRGATPVSLDKDAQ